MATVPVAGEQRILLHGVSWQTYETLLREVGRSTRLTYDRGMLEIMTPSHGHENYSRLLGRFIETMTEELNIPIHSGGSTTFRREAPQRELEPDECYWVQRESTMRGKKEFDPETDPPPDLALEVDITSSSLDRMSIYATLGVREVWRFDGSALRVCRLRGKVYVPTEESLAFPFLSLDEVLRFLGESDRLDETSLVRSFRLWVREQLLPAYQASQAAPARRARRRPKK
jgi:Uma2 family endonuclease